MIEQECERHCPWHGYQRGKVWCIKANLPVEMVLSPCPMEPGFDGRVRLKGNQRIDAPWEGTEKPSTHESAVPPRETVPTATPDAVSLRPVESASRYAVRVRGLTISSKPAPRGVQMRFD